MALLKKDYYEKDAAFWIKDVNSGKFTICIIVGEFAYLVGDHMVYDRFDILKNPKLSLEKVILPPDDPNFRI